MGTGLFTLLIVLMTFQSLWVCTKGVPDSPTITRALVLSARSASINWTIVSDANSYELSFNRAQGQQQNGECKTYLHADTHFVDGGTNFFRLSNLEEFSTYFVSVTAIDSTGRSQPSVPVQFDTYSRAPSSPPSSVRVTVNSSTVVTVIWTPVPCIDRNSVITKYIVNTIGHYYKKLYSGHSYYIHGGYKTYNYTDTIIGARNFGEIHHKIYGLIPSHGYEFQVSAVNSNGEIGPSSLAFDVRFMPKPERVHIQFKGNMVKNHGFLLREEIKEGREGLFCLTSRSACCHYDYRAGEWYHPNGSAVSIQTSRYNMYQNRDNNTVRLNQIGEGGVNGMYRCDIPDIKGNTISLYVGLYTEITGEPEIKLISFNLVSAFTIDIINLVNNVEFELNCITSGGPVEDVVWTRNGGDIPKIWSRVNKTLQDTVNAVYHNKLSVSGGFAGLYSCEIKSVRPSYTVRKSENITITSANSPTNLTVDLEGLTSIHVTWNAPEFDADVTDYRIYVFETSYRDTRTIKVNASTTAYSAHHLNYTSSYDIYIVAFSQHLPSNVVGPVRTTIGIPDPVVSLMAFPDVTSINVTWDPPIEPHGTIVTYEVEYWKIDNGSDQTHFFMDVEGSEGSEAVLTSLLPDTSYVIMVRPYTYVGAGDPVTIRSTTLKLYIVEDIEVEVINATSVNVSWSPVVIPFWNLTHYTLYYRAYSSVLQKTLNNQSINVHAQGEIPPTSFVLQILDMDPDDNIEYFFEITSNLEVQELVFVSNLSKTTVFKFDVMPFQLQLSPVDYCATWKPDKSENVEKNIHIGIAKAISKLCNCTFIVGFIRSGVFRCWNSPTEVTYRSAIVGSSAQNASSIVQFIENWVESQPALRLHAEKLELKVENKCPVRLTSLSNPECPLVNPVGNDTVSLTSGNARVTQCVKKCI